MKSNFSMLLLFVLFPLGVFSQQREIDSLETLLKSYPRKDTVRATILTKIAMYYSFIDPEKSLVLVEKNIAIAKELGSNTHLAKSYNCKGFNYEHLGKDSLALLWYRKGAKVAESTNNLNVILGSLNLIANLYNNRSEYRESLQIRMKMIAMLKDKNEPGKLGAVYTNMGVTYFFMSDYTKATEYYFKSLKAYSDANVPDRIANSYLNIGLVYKKTGDFKRSLAYYKKAEKTFISVGDQWALSSLFGNMGALYDEMNEAKRAIEYFNRGLQIALKIKDKRLEASHLTNIGALYSGNNQYKEAYDNLISAKKIYDITQNDNAMSVVLSELSELLLKCPEAILAQIGLAKGQKYRLAESYAEEALALAKAIGSPDREIASLDCLSQIYEHQGKFDKALSTFKLYKKMNDSVVNSDKKTEIARKEMQFEADKKQAVADAEIGRQKVIRYGTLVISGVLLLTGLFWFTGYRKRRNAKEIQRDLLQRAKISDVEMRVLRLQMNPHFIFNSLNSISDYMNKNDIKTADYYLSKFAKLMRGILENAEEKEIPLAEELKMLELYMQLEASRLNGKFTYEIRVDSAVNPEITMVPPLILQPFVENSIWHGMAHKNGSGKILIEARFEDDMLQCIVEDDGVGRKTGEKSNGKSYGMKITKDRIELLNKFKNTDASVRLIDLEQGTRVELRLPINEDEI